MLSTLKHNCKVILGVAMLVLTLAFGLISPISAQTANAHSSLPSLTCSWHLTPGTTWDTWSLEHHFDVELYGFKDMTGMVANGTAKIYYQSERMYLNYWKVNKWGVPTRWVAQHPAGFWDASNWTIQWPNGANAIYCPIA